MVLVILAILAAFTIPAMLKAFVEDARGKAAIAGRREAGGGGTDDTTENSQEPFTAFARKLP